MKYIKKLSTIITATGLGTLLVTGLVGCGETPPTAQEQQKEAKGAFIVIEETAIGKYKIKEEFPAEETRILLKKLDGTEKVLSKEEMDALVKEEAAKIDDGTSNLTKENPQAQSQGMGLGETIMASMAGAMLGAWIGNKLFGNKNYQNNRKAGYKSPSTYSKSQKSFNQSKTRSTSTTKKSGFFGSKKTSSSSTKSFGG